MYSIKSEDGRVFKVEHKDGRKGVFSYNQRTNLFETGYRPGYTTGHIDDIVNMCLGPVEIKTNIFQLYWLLGRGADEIRYARKDGTRAEAKIRNLTFKDMMVHYEKVGEVNPHRSLYVNAIVGVKTPEGWYTI